MPQISGTITHKWTEKGIQPANVAVNAAFMFMDIPFERPTLYYVRLDNGQRPQVSADFYHRHQVGDRVSLILPEEKDLACLLLVVLFLGLLTLGICAIVIFFRG